MSAKCLADLFQWARRREHIRIVIVGLPTMAADLVAEAVRARAWPDKLSITRVADVTSLPRRRFAVRTTCVLIAVSASGDAPNELVEVLCHRPELAVLGVSVSDGQAFLYELRPHPTIVGELTPQLLVDTARRRKAPTAATRHRDGGADDPSTSRR